MPITTRKPTPPTVLQKFRATTESFLLTVAQEEMLRRYPGAGARPVSKQGALGFLLRFVFLPGFRLTPWPLRRRLLRAFFVRPAQNWPERPWERSGGE